MTSDIEDPTDWCELYSENHAILSLSMPTDNSDSYTEVTQSFMRMSFTNSRATTLASHANMLLEKIRNVVSSKVPT